jgi:hypothetical protein
MHHLEDKIAAINYMVGRRSTMISQRYSSILQVVDPTELFLHPSLVFSTQQLQLKPP